MKLILISTKIEHPSSQSEGCSQFILALRQIGLMSPNIEIKQP